VTGESVRVDSTVSGSNMEHEGGRETGEQQHEPELSSASLRKLRVNREKWWMQCQPPINGSITNAEAMLWSNVHRRNAALFTIW
jgi:hypothetical protein